MNYEHYTMNELLRVSPCTRLEEVLQKHLGDAADRESQEEFLQKTYGDLAQELQETEDALNKIKNAISAIGPILHAICHGGAITPGAMLSIERFLGKIDVYVYYPKADQTSSGNAMHLVPADWLEKLKMADGDTAIELVEALQRGEVLTKVKEWKLAGAYAQGDES